MIFSVVAPGAKLGARAGAGARLLGTYRWYLLKATERKGKVPGVLHKSLHRHSPVNKPREATTLRTAWRTAISLTGLCGLEIQKKVTLLNGQNRAHRVLVRDLRAATSPAPVGELQAGINDDWSPPADPFVWQTRLPGFSRTRQADCNVLADSYCGIGNLAAAHNLSLEERAPRNAPGHESRLYQSF
jgi:hypothetical protein